MKLFTRITALALAGVLSVGLLTGCQTQTGSTSASGSAEDAVPETVDVNAIDDICFYLSGLDSDEVVAKTGDIQVTAGELMYWIAANCDNLLSYYYYYGVTQLPWDTTDGTGETTLADFVLEDAVNYATLQRLIDQNGKKAALPVTQEEKDAIQTALNSIEAEFADSGVALDRVLFQQGLTEDLYIWNCECDCLYEALAQANFGPESTNPPTEESIRAAREANGEYKVKHILLATIDTSTREALDDKTVAEKKVTAQKLLADLRKSADPMTLFDEYMNAHSEDPGLVTNPNGYEFTANTSVDPAFEEAALALESGQISEVVEGVSGYHIILRLPLEVNVDEDSEAYINTKMTQLTNEWVEQANIQTTKAFEKLDAQTIYERLTAYRTALAALVAPAGEETSE